MAKTINRLSATQVNNLKDDGMYADGAGLYLHISRTGAKSWVYRFKWLGKPKDMGLGPLHTVSLKEAREQATEARKKVLNGENPIQARQMHKKQANMLEISKKMTFKHCAEKYIELRKPSWKNAKHAAQWSSTMKVYVYPSIQNIPVSNITEQHIYDILKPIWMKKSETASRVRGRIEAIIGWAITLGFRTDQNPARWKNHLENLLPSTHKKRNSNHYPALPYKDLPTFMKELRKLGGTSAQCLELTILTVVRTNEAIRATWDEFDLSEGIWIIPPGRMKKGREHRVPLPQIALNLLRNRQSESDKPSDYVFESMPGKPLSNMAMLKLLERMGRKDITVHGFRSSFDDWATETTDFSESLIDMSLAHILKDKTKAAYRRGDVIEKRKVLMAAWADYCG